MGRKRRYSKKATANHILYGLQTAMSAMRCLHNPAERCTSACVARKNGSVQKVDVSHVEEDGSVVKEMYKVNPPKCMCLEALKKVANG